MLTYELPLNEIVLDFYDRLKSTSRGYASLDYHLAGYWESDLVKLDVLSGEPVDVSPDFASRHRRGEGSGVATKMKELIPRNFSKCRFRRPSAPRLSPAKLLSDGQDVIAKCYGGDITRNAN